MQGGATSSFAQIPMNLLAGGSADYVLTGSWSKKACKAAQRIGSVRVASSTEADRIYPCRGPTSCSSTPRRLRPPLHQRDHPRRRDVRLPALPRRRACWCAT